MKIKKNVYFVTSKLRKGKTEMISIYHNLLEELQTDVTNNVDFNN